MSKRMLETALATSSFGSLKPGCSHCCKRHLCRRLDGILAEIAKTQMNVWDLEFKIRTKSLQKTLNQLGFEFPNSVHNCEITQMTQREATQLLREGQELLIELKNCLNESEKSESASL